MYTSLCSIFLLLAGASTFVLFQKKAPDDVALVESLHSKIVAASKASQEWQMKPGEMKPYKAAIPLTDESFEMAPIPGGEFSMGTPATEAGRKPDEEPRHKVQIDPFWMGKYEVPWEVYIQFMESVRGGTKDELVDAVSRPTPPYVEMSFGMGFRGFPAISMTQHAGNKFAQWLSAKTGHFYRLPTEAEWEYACRAGATTAYSFGSDPAQLGDYAWYSGNSNRKYQKVGTKKPNPWGLFDMHGNVMEWTLDMYVPYPSPVAGPPVLNPWVKPTMPYPQVARGGSWHDPAADLRCGSRAKSDPSWKMQDPQEPKSIWYLTDAQWLGFRVVRPLKIPSAQEMYRYWNNGVEKD